MLTEVNIGFCQIHILLRNSLRYKPKEVNMDKAVVTRTTEIKPEVTEGCKCHCCPNAAKCQEAKRLAEEKARKEAEAKQKLEDN